VHIALRDVELRVARGDADDFDAHAAADELRDEEVAKRVEGPRADAEFLLEVLERRQDVRASWCRVTAGPRGSQFQRDRRDPGSSSTRALAPECWSR